MANHNASPSTPSAEQPRKTARLAECGYILCVSERRQIGLLMRSVAQPVASSSLADVRNLGRYASPSVQITVESSVSGDIIFGPLWIQGTRLISCLLRQLQHIAYTEHQSAYLLRLTFDDYILDPSRPVVHTMLLQRTTGFQDDSRAIAFDMGTVTGNACNEKARRLRRQSRMPQTKRSQDILFRKQHCQSRPCEICLRLASSS